MKKLFVAVTILSFTLFNKGAFAQLEKFPNKGIERTESISDAKALIINTTSAQDVQQILKTLEGVDPSTYHLTVTNTEGGKQKTTVYGTASIDNLTKIGGKTSKKGRLGGIAASDVILLVKIITHGKERHYAAITQLEKSLSKQSFKTVMLKQ